jgi:endo-1,4-beta-D-glucanase Y
MFSRSLFATCLALLSLLFSLASAHVVITYPGWRGDNLHSNGTVQDTNGLDNIYTQDGYLWPYGMQWSYPCT